MSSQLGRKYMEQLSYGMHVVRLLEKIDGDITAPHCILMLGLSRSVFIIFAIFCKPINIYIDGIYMTFLRQYLNWTILQKFATIILWLKPFYAPHSSTLNNCYESIDNNAVMELSWSGISSSHCLLNIFPLMLSPIISSIIVRFK